MADTRSVVEQWLDALEARDVERITGMLDDDVRMETEMLPRPIEGKRVLEDLVAGALDAYDSIRIDRRKMITSGRDAAVLLDVHVRFSRDLDMFGERLSTAGKELDVTGALFMEVNEAGKISRIMRVRDTLGIVQQLGLSPERVSELMRKLQERMKQPPSRAA